MFQRPDKASDQGDSGPISGAFVIACQLVLLDFSPAWSRHFVLFRFLFSVNGRVLPLLSLALGFPSQCYWLGRGWIGKRVPSGSPYREKSLIGFERL